MKNLLYVVLLVLLAGCGKKNENKNHEEIKKITKTEVTEEEDDEDGNPISSTEKTVVEQEVEPANPKAQEPEILDDNMLEEVDVREVDGRQEGFVQHINPPTKRIFFGFNVHDINHHHHHILDEVAKELVKNRNLKIEIQGNCDSRGSRSYNIALGERRANAVATYLKKKGVVSNQIIVISFGQRVLVEGDTEEAYSQNRVAIMVISEK